MGTSESYIKYVISCLDKNMVTEYKKMFGEYMIYINRKPLLLVCDNTVYVKMIPQLRGILDENSIGYPYNGAKEHYILDFENSVLTNEVINILDINIQQKLRKNKPK
ncbi:MAG: hypothetical protein LBV51_00910 [Acholeplasmatales bacterium]|jgi:TfoX/Sxy family transcriptional regulator of competence genes|nr:hypothetical protein [Acholeplasmatales bacterium]